MDIEWILWIPFKWFKWFPFVPPLAERITFSNAPSRQEFNEGDTALILCNVVSSPAPQILWKYKGARIYSNKDGEWLPVPTCPSKERERERSSHSSPTLSILLTHLLRLLHAISSFLALQNHANTLSGARRWVSDPCARCTRVEIVFSGLAWGGSCHQDVSLKIDETPAWCIRWAGEGKRFWRQRKRKRVKGSDLKSSAGPSSFTPQDTRFNNINQI